MGSRMKKTDSQTKGKKKRGQARVSASITSPAMKNPVRNPVVGAILGPGGSRRTHLNELTSSAVPKTAGITVEKARDARRACSTGPIEPSSR